MSNYNTQQQYAAYKAAYQTTDNKTQQVVMVYDGILRAVYQAKQAILDEDIETRFNLLDKASQTILALQASLDFENGGEVAVTLNGYYDIIFAKIHLINQTNDVADCDALIEEIKGMRGSWQYVLEMTSNGEAAKHPTLPEASSLQVSI